MKTLKEMSIRMRYVLLSINIICLILFGILLAIAKTEQKPLYTQQMAQRWETKNTPRLAQISAFFSAEKNMQLSEIQTINGSVLSRLHDDSYYDKDQKGRVMVDSYSGECKVELRKDTNKVNATAVGVGDDFFRFHPIELLSGNYIYGEDLNHDRVVIDANLAWLLFGSNNVVGMQIWMDDYVYTVAGVVAVDEDRLSQAAYGSVNRVYIMYDDLKQKREDLKITCYEAVLPDPIHNYARNLVGEACGLDMEETESISTSGLCYGDCEVLDNSARFKSFVLLSHLRRNQYKSMRTNGIVYPYWENIARVAEDQQMRLLIIRMVLLVVPLISLVGLIYVLWLEKTWTVSGIFMKMIDAHREKRAEEAERERRLKLEWEKTDKPDEIVEEIVEEPDEQIQESLDDLFMSEDWNVN